MDYFYHECNARNSEALLRLRLRHKSAGYGVYFLLLEILSQRKEFKCFKDYNIIAFELREDAKLIKSVVEDFGLFAFTDDGKYFYSEGFNRRAEKSADISKKRKAAAKIAAAKRWGTELKEDNEEEEKTPKPLIEKKEPADIFNEMKQSQFWVECMCMKFHYEQVELYDRIDEFRLDCDCRGNKHDNLRECKNHFTSWLMIKQQKEKEDAATQRKSESRRASNDVTATKAEDYEGAF